jgi:hypothetical protein
MHRLVLRCKWKCKTASVVFSGLELQVGTDRAVERKHQIAIATWPRRTRHRARRGMRVDISIRITRIAIAHKYQRRGGIAEDL